MTSARDTSLLELLERISALNGDLREHIVEGRLDRLAQVLDDREACLRQLTSMELDVHAMSDPVKRRVEALRTEGQELREWLQGEKDDVAAALSSLRSQRVDPFREQLVGATVLDQRV